MRRSLDPMKLLSGVHSLSAESGRKALAGWVALSWVGVLLSAATTAFGEPLTAEGATYFESKVRPLLIERCLDCHGEKKQKGGLRLDSKVGWQTGGEHGPALVPGQPEASLIIKAISRHDPDLAMPPDEALGERERQVLVEWVKRGAPDPRDSAVNPPSAPTGGRDHWAYQPIGDPSPPPVRDTSWPRVGLDAFVLARLDAENLRPVADADRHTWLRRVTFDLTGMPPTVDEIKAFVGDDSSSARERVVDRLLASSAFGEKWARHWLDLVGYADQLGTVNDVPAPYAWRYRDYVIRAFNADKPFDRFVREQIAGDLLSASDPETRREALTATGFLLLGEIHIVTADKVQLGADIVDHQIQKIGTTFLGQTLGCVRCHDHKFDPIRIEDYYGLAGIFGSTEGSYMTERGVWSSILALELPETAAEQAERERRWGEHLVQMEKLKIERAGLAKQRDEIDRQTRQLTNSTPPVAATVALPASKAGDRSVEPAKAVAADERRLPELKARKADVEKKMASLDTRLLHLGYLEPRADFAYGVRDTAKPGDGPIHIRGNARAPGRTVPRGFVRVVSSAPWPRIPDGTSGRLQLADWLTSPENPLPARVTVNRVWQRMFGEGLVRSVDYFGTRGERPTHPELLDWLARDFVRSGWSQKRLIRQIALSRTYGLSTGNDATLAERDPDNRLLWRMNRRRLDAESLRDAVLAVSGQLRSCAGGPALALHLLENIGGLDPKDVNPVSFRTSVFPEEQHRQRTIYLPVVRSRAQPGPAELRNLFDFVQPTEMTGQRPSTSVATQALFLMNSDFLRAHAARLAAWVLERDAADNRARLDALYLRTLNRPVTDSEVARAEQFLDASSAADKEKRAAAWSEFCQALLSSNEFLFRI